MTLSVIASGFEIKYNKPKQMKTDNLFFRTMIIETFKI